jgi:hypothetical protein
MPGFVSERGALAANDSATKSRTSGGGTVMWTPAPAHRRTQPKYRLSRSQTVGAAFSEAVILRRAALHDQFGRYPLTSTTN